ncbi:MAG TPA: hypothetical protein VLS93_13945 [Anaeromyxobacteraceae bacterium]|nr:hypothetical protein [Anaeromyxobacteraceae bacterium]
MSASLRFDVSVQAYVYAYAVKNEPSSVQAVETFAVDVASPVSRIAGPAGWRGRRMDTRPWVKWAALQVADPDHVTNDASVPPSTVQIKPGSTLAGFSFQSPKPPGLAAFHASGFVQFPRATGSTPAEAELRAEQLAERIERECPKLARPLIDQGVTGPTVGPVDATPIHIDLKPGEEPNAVNPRSQGVVPLAILGSATLDARAIDAGTIQLVPSGAAPRDAGRVEDVNGDGRPDLLLHFSTPAIGLRCGDTTVVLGARTRGGERLAGFDSVATPGCR